MELGATRYEYPCNATISLCSAARHKRQVVNVLSTQDPLDQTEATHMTMITLCLHTLSLKVPKRELVSAMGSFGPRGGPPCNRCKQLPSVYHSDEFGLLCNRCLQDESNNHLAEYWGHMHRTHPVLGDTIVTVHIAEFLLGTGLDAYCYCGECNPNWFLRGWVCYDCN